MRKFFVCITACIYAAGSFSQALTKADYKRAVGFIAQNLNNKKIYNINVVPAWAGDSTAMAFVTQSRDEKLFSKIEFNKMEVLRYLIMSGSRSC